MPTRIESRRRLTRPLTLVLIGVSTLLAGAFDLARLFALSLSADGEFSGSTEIELVIVRWATVGVGLLLLVASILSQVMKRPRVLHRIADDVRAWSQETPNPRLLRCNVGWFAATLGYLASMLVVLVIGRGYSEGNVPYFYRVLTRESGLYETATAIMLAIAGICLLRSSWRLLKMHGSGGWIRFVSPAALGMLLLLASLEEISWGQHYLGFATPKAMQAVNVQAEFNFHNMLGYWANNVLLVFFVAFVGILPILARCFWDVAYSCERLHIPVASFLFLPFALVSIVFDEREPFGSLFHHPIWRLSEVREALFGIVMLAMCSEFWLRLQALDVDASGRER